MTDPFAEIPSPLRIAPSIDLTVEHFTIFSQTGPGALRLRLDDRHDKKLRSGNSRIALDHPAGAGKLQIQNPSVNRDRPTSSIEIGTAKFGPRRFEATLSG
jgi:hypothetical protein